MATALHHYDTDYGATVLAEASALRDAGFAMHWLFPKTKAPAGGAGWPSHPVATVEQLASTYREGMNLGLRTGEPSHVAGMYAHVFDVDIRFPDLADEAWEEFDRMLPGVRETLPCVVSGSGGASRHLHFLTDRAFQGRMLAVSKGKHRGADGSLRHDWEIDLFGSSRQVVCPPSIHPVTGIAYRWEREYDLDGLEFGGGPIIDSDIIEALGVAETNADEVEVRAPIVRSLKEIEQDLDIIPMGYWDKYHDWLTIGQALHHQFGGLNQGFDLWMLYSKRFTNFDPKKRGEDFVLKKCLRKYRGFGHNRRTPVTFATPLMWANDARHIIRAKTWDSELDDLADPSTDDTTERSEFDELLNEPLQAANDEDVFSIGLETAAPDDWKTLLAYTEKGIVANLPNIELIMKNDPRLKGLCQRNEFTQETVQRIAPGHKSKSRANAAKDARQLVGPIWQVRDTLNGETWSNDRDCAVRSIIETPKTQGGYGIKVSDRDLKAATVLAARENGFHPIREYLEGVAWDGVERIDRLFVDYLGTEDNVYTRQVARLMMIAAVARVFEPGCKWDHAVILEGAQGVGKSTFIRILGRNWSVELDGNFHDAKSMVEKLQGGWIVELPELTGFAKSEVQDIKAFISRQFDKVRLAYEARAQAFPRQSILIGSTNSGEYLRDATGGRRFLPIECHVKAIDTARFRKDVDQYWAEAMSVYRSMHAELNSTESGLHLYLSGEALAYASGLQESRRVETAEDGIVGRIMCWLDTPVTSGSIDEDAVPQFRNVTCSEELFRALSADDKTILRASVQRAISMVPGWKKGEGVNARHVFPMPIGRQRYFERIGSPGRLQPLSAGAA